MEIYIIVGGSAFLSFYLTLVLLQKEIKRFKTKNIQIAWITDRVSVWDEDLSQNFIERLFFPFVRRIKENFKQKMIKKGKDKTVKKSSAKMEETLRLAGIAMTPSAFFRLRMVVTFVMILVGLIIAKLAAINPTIQFFIVVVALSVPLVSPLFILKARIRGRKDSIQNQLPNVMDVLSVSVEAGLSFDASLLKVIERFDGPLIDGLTMVYKEIQMGRPRRETLRGLSEKSNVKGLQSFAAAVIQAEQYGSPLKNVLNQQAIQLREERRLLAQEKGAKTPIKIMIPMLLLVFPVIFIVVLGPTVIQLVTEYL